MIKKIKFNVSKKDLFNFFDFALDCPFQVGDSNHHQCLITTKF